MAVRLPSPLTEVADDRLARFLTPAVRALQDKAFGGPSGCWLIDDRFAFGGFARRTADLGRFIADFAARYGLTLEPRGTASPWTGSTWPR